MPTVPPVTLDQLKAHLQMTAGAGADDDELTMHLEGATDVCEGEIGAILTRSYTERITGTGGVLIASYRPLVEVTSVADVDGTTYDPADLDVDRSGVIRRLSGTFARGRYDLEYVSGSAEDAADVPSAVKIAVMIVAGHMWETQRGRQARQGFIPGEGVTPVDQGALILSGFSLPRRALELLKPYRLAPSVA